MYAYIHVYRSEIYGMTYTHMSNRCQNHVSVEFMPNVAVVACLGSGTLTRLVRELTKCISQKAFAGVVM